MQASYPIVYTRTIMKTKRYAVICTLGLCLVAIACLPRWRSLVIGFVLGGIASALHMRVLEIRVDAILRQTRTSMLFVLLGPLVGLMVLAAPLACAYFLPEYIAWQGVAVGILARKAMLYLGALRGGPADDQ